MREEPKKEKRELQQVKKSSDICYYSQTKQTQAVREA